MAGLIPQQFIDDVLDRVDIVEVIDKRVTLKKAGRNYTACCPFHNEKTPSFSVNPDKQFYYCFGCGAGGNSVGFIMDYDSLDFPAAVESLAAMVGLEVPREEQRPGSDNQRQRKKQSESLYDALAWTSRHFQTQLRKHSNKKQAIDYLKSRGLSGEVCRDFGIGYAPPGWDNLLNAVEDNDQRKQRIAQLETAGMLVKKENGDFYDRFRERIIFPIRDNRGRVIAFGGRVFNDDKPKYLNSPETPVFHKQRELYGLFEARKANRQLDYLLLVEGYMDVVSLVQYGINNAVATLGTSSSIYHLEKIFRHSSKLVVCFDGDEAGKKAASRLLETALPAMSDGREICFLFLPDGEDPDTYVRDKGKQAFDHLVEQAMPLETLLFATAGEGINLSSGAGKAKLSQRALPLIQKLPVGVFKQLMLAKLASETGADISLLKSREAELTAAKFKSQSASQSASNNRTDGRSKNKQDYSGDQKNSHASQASGHDNRPSNTRDSAQGKRQNDSQRGQQGSGQSTLGIEKTPIVWSIALLLHYPQLAQEVPMPAALSMIDSEEARLLQKLVDHIKSQTHQVTTSTLLGYWHGTAEAAALNHCANRHKPPEQETVALEEFADTISRIEEQFEDKKIDRFIAELKQRPLSDLSDEERQMLKSIGLQKASSQNPND